MTGFAPKQTVWRLVALAGRRGLDVRLVVDTDAAAVVDAIESAAAAAGIELARVDEEASP